MPFYAALTQNVFSVRLLSFSRYLAFIKARLTYVGIENVLEWSCYITAIIFVIDFSECHAETVRHRVRVVIRSLPICLQPSNRSRLV